MIHLSARITYHCRNETVTQHSQDTLLNASEHTRHDAAGLGARAFLWLSGTPLSSVFVLCISLAITVAFWHRETNDLENHQQQHIGRVAERISAQLQARMFSYEELLQGGAGLFAALPDVSSVVWQDYFSNLGLDTRLRGAQFVGFAARDPATETLSVSLVYPENAENIRARGYRPAEEANQRAALARARDTGRVALSARSTLPVESQIRVQPGFVLYLPVYRRGANPGTEQERRAALTGYLLCALRIEDLLRDMRFDLESDAVVDLFDGTPGPGTLLFTSRGANAPAVSQERRIDVGGHSWTLRVGSSPEFDALSDKRRPLLILATGSVLSVTLAGLVLLGARHQRRLMDAHRELQEGHSRYLSLVNSVPGTVFRVGPTLPWRLTYISEGVGELTGKPPGYWLSARNFLQELVHPEDLDRVSRVAAWASTRGAPFEVEYRLRSEDSQPRWIKQRARPMLAESGEILGISGVLTDVTHTRNLMDTLARQRETLEEQVAARTVELLVAKESAEAASTAKSRFLSTMSHELRTPMNAVIGYATLLAAQETDPARHRQIERILIAGKELLELLNRVLDYARTDAGTLDLELAPFPVADILDAAVSRLREGLAGRAVTWTIETAGEIPARVIGDARRIREVLFELLDNAIKYTASGSIAVALRSQQTGESIELGFEVRDTGCGIDAGMRERLFSAFEQADGSSTRKHGGIGMGLALARRLVLLMGGSIGVDTAPGGGSRFWFTVRVDASADAPHTLQWRAAEALHDQPAPIADNTDRLAPEEREKLRSVCATLSGMLRAGELDVRDVLQAHAPLLTSAFPELAPRIVEAVESFDFDAALDSLEGGCRHAGLDLA